MENPLLKKLLLKPGHSVLIVNQPESTEAIFGDIPDSVHFHYEDAARFDVLLIFATTRAILASVLTQRASAINSKTVCWVIYPKAKTALSSDLNLMQSWDSITAFNLAPCASAAINNVWTAIRIKPADAVKKSGLGNAEIAKGEFGAYIDVANKKILLPPFIEEFLATHAKASSYFETLSYSNKKEYLIWVLSAKQEKTRQDRLTKMVQKLNEGKKNPFEK